MLSKKSKARLWKDDRLGARGPLSSSAGHDINYIGLAGPLAHIGRNGHPPSVPLNLVGDFGADLYF